MRSTFAVAAFVAAAAAVPQGVSADIKPSTSAPAGCEANYPGSFTIEVVNVTTTDKRSLKKREDMPVTITLKDSVFTDSMGRIGAVVANGQIQFDGPPAQTGSKYTAGWSVCGNGTVALGSQVVFYQCLSGEFYNLYDHKLGEQCGPIYIQAVGASSNVAQQGDGQVTAGRPATQISDGQVQASTGSPVTQIGDGQVQAPTGGAKVTQIGDGQIQAPTGAMVTQIADGQLQVPTGKPVTQIGDGQIQAPVQTGKPVTQIGDGQIQAPTGVKVTQIGDGQIQAPTGKPVTQISDGQIQAPTGKPVTQISDGQIQAPTGKPVTQISDGQIQAPKTTPTAAPTRPANGTVTSATKGPIAATGAAVANAVGAFGIFAGAVAVALL